MVEKRQKKKQEALSQTSPLESLLFNKNYQLTFLLNIFNLIPFITEN